MRASVRDCGLWYNAVNMEKLATDIYTFEKLVKNGFTYIDKTDRLWPLVNKGGYNEAHDSV